MVAKKGILNYPPLIHRTADDIPAVNARLKEITDAFAKLRISNGKILDDHATLIDAGGGGGSTPTYIHVQEQQTSGTNGGSSSGGSQQRILNTQVVNSIVGASLSSNQITLPAGTYEVYTSAPAFDANTHKIVLYDTTAAANVLVGTSAFTSPSDGVSTLSVINGTFILGVSSVLELRHYIQTAAATFGLGVGTASGDVEVYADVFIVKIG